MDMIGNDVIYNGQVLRLTRFWGNQKPCLWIHTPSQRSIPKMKFVGGYPDEYCIFLDELTKEELAGITSIEGVQLDLKCLLEKTSKQ